MDVRRLSARTVVAHKCAYMDVKNETARKGAVVGHSALMAGSVSYAANVVVQASVNISDEEHGAQSAAQRRKYCHPSTIFIQ